MIDTWLVGMAFDHGRVMVGTVERVVPRTCGLLVHRAMIVSFAASEHHCCHCSLPPPRPPHLPAQASIVCKHVEEAGVGESEGSLVACNSAASGAVGTPTVVVSADPSLPLEDVVVERASASEGSRRAWDAKVATWKLSELPFLHHSSGYVFVYKQHDLHMDHPDVPTTLQTMLCHTLPSLVDPKTKHGFRHALFEPSRTATLPPTPTSPTAPRPAD